MGQDAVAEAGDLPVEGTIPVDRHPRAPVDLFGQLGDAGLEPQDFLLGLGDVAKQIGDKRLQRARRRGRCGRLGRLARQLHAHVRQLCHPRAS